ncbi:MAG: PKD domain-containing protein [Planctomycetota bacterium]
MSHYTRSLWFISALVLFTGGSALAATLPADSYEADNDNAADGALDNLSTTTRGLAKTITSGTTQKHSLHVGGSFLGGPADRDVVKFTLTAASDVILQTDENIGPCDTVLRLFDSSGVEIGSDDNGNTAGNGASSLFMTNLAAGTYYACVEQHGLSNGDDALAIESYKLSFISAATGRRLSPLITSKSSVPAALGGTFNYIITTLGSAPMFFSVQGLPPGLALSGSTITGILTQLGTFTATLTVTNGAKPDSTLSVTITVTAFGVISSYAGTGSARLSGDNDLAALASLNTPNGVALDSKNNLYIADTNNHVIRIVDAQTRIIKTFAGTGLAGLSGNGGKALNAKLNSPRGVAVDSADNIYIVDTGNNMIRKVTSGIISRVAGIGGTAGYTGDGGSALNARFDTPSALTLDAAGNFYIADTNNNVVRKVTVATGIISRFAGDGTGAAGNTGDGGAATAATLRSPTGVAMDTAGNVYIADSQNHRIRCVATNGIISNFAGSPTAESGSTGDGGAATAALLDLPLGVSLDSTGNLYIADSNNRAIRKVSGGNIATLVGGGTPDYSLADYGASLTDGGAVASAVLRSPVNVAVDATGANITIVDKFAHRIRRAAIATVPNITSVLTLSATQNQPLTAPFYVLATGHPAPSISAEGLPDGLSLHNGVISGVPTQTGIANVLLTAANSRGSDVKTLCITITGDIASTLTYSDTAPAITVSPNPASVDAIVIFVAPTVTGGADLKEYSWDFGDPDDIQSHLGSVASYTYSTVGVYLVTLTIDDGDTTLTLIATVAINASDVTEKMLISKARFKFNFAIANKDSISISGSAPFRKIGVVDGVIVNVNVGDIAHSYTLNSKGSSNGSGGKNDVFKLSVRTSDPPFDPAGLYVMGKFKLLIRADTFSDDLANLGFKQNVTTAIPIKVPILITINDDSYLEIVTIAFKSNEKTGSGAKMSDGGMTR